MTYEIRRYEKRGSDKDNLLTAQQTKAAVFFDDDSRVTAIRFNLGDWRPTDDGFDQSGQMITPTVGYLQLYDTVIIIIIFTHGTLNPEG